MTTPERELENRVPDPNQAPETLASGRRAILRALGGTPVILTLVAGSAHAEYIDGVYRPGEKYVPRCAPPGQGGTNPGNEGGDPFGHCRND